MEENKEEETKVVEEKREKKGVFLGLTPLQLLLLVVVILLFFGAAFATSYFKRLSKNLDYNIQQNTPAMMEEEEGGTVIMPPEESMMEEESEESTVEEDEEELIKEAVLAGVGVTEDEVDFEITENTGYFAKGNIKDKGSEVGGGYWLAAKTTSGWVHVYDGQSTPTCDQIDPYNFPTDMVEECLDDNGQVIVR